MGETPLELATRLRDEAAAGGLTKMGEISIMIVDARNFPSVRHFGATSEDGKKILLSPRLAEQPGHVIEGVVAHELGHASDFLYPAHWEKAFGRWYRYQKRHRYTAWRRRSADEVERAADGIAKTMFGVTIKYGGECLVQSTRAGVSPRPRGLR